MNRDWRDFEAKSGEEMTPRGRVDVPTVKSQGGAVLEVVDHGLEGQFDGRKRETVAGVVDELPVSRRERFWRRTWRHWESQSQEAFGPTEGAEDLAATFGMNPRDEFATAFHRELMRLMCVTFAESFFDQELLGFSEVVADDEVLGVVRERAEFPEGQREFWRLSCRPASKKSVPPMSGGEGGQVEPL